MRVHPRHLHIFRLPQTLSLSGFFLLALISLSLFPTIKRSLPDRPDIQGRLAKALLIPLAIADVRESTLELDPALTM